MEAAQKAINKDEYLKKLYHQLVHRRDRAKAKVAVARQLLVRTYHVAGG